MRPPLKPLICTLVVFLAVPARAAQDVNAILKKVDSLFRSRSSVGTLEMSVENPHWTRTMRFKIWTQGLTKTFILIESPKKDEGTATLRLGNDMWNYFPNIGKVVRIPSSMMTGSWMGSDITNDDLVKETTFEKDYTSRILEDESRGDELAIESTPKGSAATVWGKVVTHVRKADLIVTEQDYYEENGKKAREMRFSDVKTLSGKKIPTLIEVVPLAREKGGKTTVRYLDEKFDVPVAPQVFSLEHLRRGR